LIREKKITHNSTTLYSAPQQFIGKMQIHAQFQAPYKRFVNRDALWLLETQYQDHVVSRVDITDVAVTYYYCCCCVVVDRCCDDDDDDV
jgi:hypothetical protein